MEIVNSENKNIISEKEKLTTVTLDEFLSEPTPEKVMSISKSLEDLYVPSPDVLKEEGILKKDDDLLSVVSEHHQSTMSTVEKTQNDLMIKMDNLMSALLASNLAQTAMKESLKIFQNDMDAKVSNIYNRLATIESKISTLRAPITKEEYGSISKKAPQKESPIIRFDDSEGELSEASDVSGFEQAVEKKRVSALREARNLGMAEASSSNLKKEQLYKPGYSSTIMQPKISKTIEKIGGAEIDMDF